MGLGSPECPVKYQSLKAMPHDPGYIAYSLGKRLANASSFHLYPDKTNHALMSLSTSLLRQFLLPLARRITLWRPRMYHLDLLFQRRIDQSMPSQPCLSFKLWGDDVCAKHLTAATYRNNM